MSYSEEFHIALERTSRFNLAPPENFSETSGRILNDKRVRNFDRVVMSRVLESMIYYEKMVGQCIPIHLKAHPILEEWLPCPVYFTLGWVDDGTSKGINKFDENMISDKLKNGHQDSTMDIHAWITLPSMEIIDLTLCTTLNMRQQCEDYAGGIILKKADEMVGLSYKPMLVGDKFLSRIGVLHSGIWF